MKTNGINIKYWKIGKFHKQIEEMKVFRLLVADPSLQVTQILGRNNFQSVVPPLVRECTVVHILQS